MIDDFFLYLAALAKQPVFWISVAIAVHLWRTRNDTTNA